MADTTTLQTRSAVTVEGIEKFKLYIEVTDKGELPSDALFLLQIVDTADPKQDIFQRVVTLADFTEYLEDRTTVIAANGEVYRAPTHIFYYDNLETAVNAQDVIKSRIDELVNDWETYQASFETASETTTHPRLDLDVFNAAVQDYDDAVLAEAVAETIRDDAKTAYDKAVADAAVAATTAIDAQLRSESCSEALAAYNSALTVLNTLYSNADTFRGAAGTFSIAANTFEGESDQFDADAQTFLDAATGTPPSAGEKSSFQTQINDHITDHGVYAGALSTHDAAKATFDTELAQALAEKSEAAGAWLASVTALCSDLSADTTAAQSAKTTADTLVATERTAYEDTQAAYEAAQSVTETTLAAVRALKPDYDPEASA